MDEDQEHPEPKIPLPAVILIGLIFVVDDIADVVLSIALIDKLIQLALGTIFIYLYIKKVPPIRQFIAWVFEMIPWVSVFPIMTIGWIITVWADRHQESVAAQALTAAASFTPRGGGPPGVPGGIGTRQLERMREVDEKLAATRPEFAEHIGLQQNEQSQGKGSDSTEERRPSRQPAATGAGAAGVAASAEEPAETRQRAGESYAEEFSKEHSPYTPLEELHTETPRATPASTTNHDSVEVGNNGVVDLRERRRAT